MYESLGSRSKVCAVGIGTFMQQENIWRINDTKKVGCYPHHEHGKNHSRSEDFPIALTRVSRLLHTKCVLQGLIFQSFKRSLFLRTSSALYELALKMLGIYEEKRYSGIESWQSNAVALCTQVSAWWGCIVWRAGQTVVPGGYSQHKGMYTIAPSRH